MELRKLNTGIVCDLAHEIEICVNSRVNSAISAGIYRIIRCTRGETDHLGGATDRDVNRTTAVAVASIEPASARNKLKVGFVSELLLVCIEIVCGGASDAYHVHLDLPLDAESPGAVEVVIAESDEGHSCSTVQFRGTCNRNRRRGCSLPQDRHRHIRQFVGLLIPRVHSDASDIDQFSVLQLVLIRRIQGNDVCLPGLNETVPRRKHDAW